MLILYEIERLGNIDFFKDDFLFHKKFNKYY